MHNRMFAAAIVSLLILSSDGCTTRPKPSKARPRPAMSNTWPMYQHDASHNAVFTGGVATVQWSRDLGGRVNGGLAVVDGTLFVDTFSDKVIALDASDGSIRWQANVDNIVMSSPIIAEGLIFVGTGHNGSLNGGQSSFVYANNNQVSSEQIWGRVEGDHIVAFDANTGEKRWSYKTAGEDMPSAAYTAGKLVFANGDMNAYGLRASTGQALWQQHLGGLATMSSAALAGSAVIVGICSGSTYRGSTVALAPSSGTVLWRASFGDCDAAPTVAGDEVIVSGVDGNDLPFGHGGRGVVAALDERDGHVIWSYRSRLAGPYTRIGSNERAITGTYAFGRYFQAFPTSDELMAFDAKNGAVEWLFHTTAPVKMSVVVAQGVVYAGDTAGLLYALDARSGRLLSTRAFDQPFATSPPVVVGGTLYIVAGSSIYALPLASPRQALREGLPTVRSSRGM